MAAAIPDSPLRGVVVLVEGVEHALALARQLPGWGLLTGPVDCVGGLSRSQKQALEDNALLFPAERPTDIVTSSGIEHVQLAAVDVVIRANAGVGLLPLPPAGLIEHNDTPARPLLLIDFLDHDDRVLQRRARQRQEAYGEAEWFEVGADPVQARVEAFLAARR